jgi:hypothetical protein
MASTADDQQFTGTLPVKLLVKLPGGRPCPRLNLPAKDRWKNSGTPREDNCMGILRKFWRPAAVMMCAGVLSLGLTTAAQAGTTSLSPRNNCGGANVNVQWSQNPITHAGQIHIWGELWNNKCKTGITYLFVSCNWIGP